jgi:glycosyltransferase involved in cell wall biosynthesis
VKLLVLSFFPAFVPPGSGGEQRLFHLYHELGRHCDVTLLSSTHVDVAEERVLHGDRFIERRIPKDHHFGTQWQQLSALAGDGDLSAVCVAACGRFATPLHQAYLEEYAAADIIVHESPYTVDYDLLIGLDDKPRVFSSHNCESQLIRQLHPLAKSAPLHDIVDRCERKLLRHADLVTYCAESDLLGFVQSLGAAPALARELPNGLVPLPRPAPGRVAAARPIAIFVGSAHLPNIEAARFIAQELAPAVPEVDFHVVGHCLPEGSYAPNVVRHGAVTGKDKERLLGAADIGINPMSTGSGSNLKVLEFFARGLAVLSTEFGLRGFHVRPGTDCVVSSLSGFPGALRQLAADRTRLGELGDGGRRAVEQRYAWSSLVQTHHQSLLALVTPTGRPLAGDFVLGLNDYDPTASAGGGPVRIQGLYRAVQHERPVVYLCFSPQGEFAVEAAGPRMTVIKVPKSAEHQREESEANARFWVAVSDIVAIRHAAANPFMVALYQILGARAEVVVIDHPYMVGLPASFGDPFVYSSHNDETALKAEMLQWHPDKEHHLAAVAEAESLAVRAASLVVAVSADDAVSLLRGRASGAPTLVVRNGAAAPAAVLPEDDVLAGTRVLAPSVAFVGSGHMPNVASAKFIVEHLAPACPEITFHILGSVCGALPLPLPANVQAWGTVSESLKTAVLERCTAAVNPMFGGGGSNVKLADFLGHGLHVVGTPFGCRGYPDDIEPHLTVASAEELAQALRRTVQQPDINSAPLRQARRAVFDRCLSMSTLAVDFAEALVGLRKPRLKVLFVTYRWVWPIRGGAEAHLLEYVRALGADGRFQVDVVSTDVDQIADRYRFATEYTPATTCGAPAPLCHVRYRRFPVQVRPPAVILDAAREIWRRQPVLEHALYLSDPKPLQRPTGLAWGWGGPEGEPGRPRRWAMHFFGLHLAQAARVLVRARATQRGGLLVLDGERRFIAQVELAPALTVSFDAEAGPVSFEVSAPCRPEDDARPLGLFVESVEVDGTPLDLAGPLLCDRGDTDASQTFLRLHEAAATSRLGRGGELGESRGPHAPELDAFLHAHAGEYDLILTHNPVFRPAQVAARAGREAGVPVVMVPHAHLDDDYYHFPDVLRSIVGASAVLAAPQAACAFLRQQGAPRVEYLPPGFDTTQTGTDADVAAFREVWRDPRPFVLVLGRKSPAKGYRAVIAAVERLATEQAVAAVLIGPDDDGEAVVSTHAGYLGPQPAQVVRGALRACVALVSMSSSESFGMVLLESWIAGRPVIASRRCAAFADLVEHGRNGLMAGQEDLHDAIRSLLVAPDLADRLGQAGHQQALEFDHAVINRRFIDICLSLCDGQAASATPGSHPSRSQEE